MVTRLILCSVLIAGSISAAPQPLQVDTQSKKLVQSELNMVDATITFGNFTVSDSLGIPTITTGSTNGTKIGATGNKLGLFGATPIVRPSSTTDLRVALINLGLYTTGGATPLNLNSGAFTAGTITGTNGTLTGTLGVTGAFTGSSVSLSGNEAITGTLGVTGVSTLHVIIGTNQTLSGTLGVTGNSAFGGTVGITGALTGSSYAFGGNGSVGGTFDASGDTTLGGTLNVTDDATFEREVTIGDNVAIGGNLGLDGNIIGDGSLTISGASTLSTMSATTGVFSGTLSAGPFTGTTATLSGTLGVTGATTMAALSGTTGTFSGTFNATGNSTFGGTVGITSNATVGGTLGVIGATTASSIAASGNATIGGTFGVTGATTLSAVSATTGTFSSAISATNGTFSGNGTFGGTLGVTGATTGSTASYSSTVRGVVQDKGGQVFNVKAYGAVGDDSTDNTAFINATLAAAGSRPVIFFPAGTYRTDFVTWPSDCTVIGAGKGTTIIKVKSGASGGSSNLLFYFPDGNSHLTIRDLTLDGNRGNQVAPTAAGSNAILFIGGDNFFGENLEITHSEAAGVFVGSNTTADNFTFKNCHIHDNGGTVNNAGIGIGIFSGGAVTPTNITIDGGTIENNYNTVTRPNDSTGVNLQVSGATIKGVTFKNNYNVAGAQLAVTDSGDGTGIVNAAITGNTIIKTSTFGSPVDDTIGIEVNGRIFAITGNIINGFTTNGINIEAAGGYGTITGNTLYNGPYAIRLFGLTTDTVSNIAIDGNEFRTTTCGVLYNNLNTYISYGINENTTATNPYLVTGGSLSATNSSQVVGGLDVTGNLTAGNLVPTYQVTQTLGSSGGFSFTGIPATYHELSITVSGRGTIAATSISVLMQFNGDTGANYEWIEFAGATQTAQTSVRVGVAAAATGPSNYPGSFTVTIPAYSGTTFNKSFMSLNVYSATAGTLVPLNEFGVWKNTVAINRVDIFTGSNAFATGSTATLTAR